MSSSTSSHPPDDRPLNHYGTTEPRPLLVGAAIEPRPEYDGSLSSLPSLGATLPPPQLSQDQSDSFLNLSSLQFIDQKPSSSSVSMLGRLSGVIINPIISTATAAVHTISAGSSPSTSTTQPPWLVQQSISPSSQSGSLHQSAGAPSPVSITKLMANRKYRQATIIKEGILDKWTNYVGAWRTRYFIIEPGILKYANSPGHPIKETFPLVLCTTRFCPSEPLRLEVEHPHGVLYLRMPSGQEKRSWIEALQRAKHIFQKPGPSLARSSGTSSSPMGLQQASSSSSASRPRLSSGSSQQIVPSSVAVPYAPPFEVGAERELTRERDELTRGRDAISQSDSGDEKSPMISLMENCVTCRQSLQSARADVQRQQALMLRLAGRVRDQQYREDAKNLSVRLVERLDLLQMIMARHLIGSEALAAEERAQRRALEKSLRTMAKHNYRMKNRLRKLQWLLAEEEPPKEMISSLPLDSQTEVPSEWIKPTDPPINRAAKEVAGASAELLDTGPEIPHSEGSDGPTLGDATNRGDEDSISAAAALTRQQKVERKRRIVYSILAGGFSSDDGGEQESASTESEDGCSSVGRRQVEEEQEDLDDEFFDVEEAGNTSAANTASNADSLPIFVTMQSLIDSSASSLQANIIRRTQLPKPRTEFKVSLWSILKDCIGRDLSTISMPVYFNEPTSFLQRLAEDFQYANLLKEASRHSSPIDRLLWVVVFTVSPYSSAIGRTYKPFNPLLGETFELSHRGFRFIAEQVGHHPPVTAYNASSKEFQAYGHMTVKNRFTGKSLEVSLPGTSNVCLYVRPIEKAAFVEYEDGGIHQEYFSFQRVRAFVNNVIFGKLSLEMFGQVVVTSHTCGTCAYIEYLRQGWWSREMHVIRGTIFDPEGKPRLRIGGWWSKELWVETLEPHNNPGVPKLRHAGDVRPSDGETTSGSSLGATPPRDIGRTASEEGSVGLNVQPEHKGEKHMRQQQAHQDCDVTNGCRDSVYYYSRDTDEFNIKWDALVSIPGTRRVLWRPEPRSPTASLYYEFGQLALELNDLSEDYDISRGAAIPTTDSRYRPDQRWLEQGDTEKANSEKTRMEEKQRAAARLRVRGEADYRPRWFVKSGDGENPIWTFTGEYWLVKEKNAFVKSIDIF